jgi:hypothetical protein
MTTVVRMLTEAELKECRDSNGRVIFLMALAKFCAANNLHVDSSAGTRGVDSLDGAKHG